MSNPNRSRKTPIRRGKKSDKKKDKRLKQSGNIDSPPNNDLSTFFGGEEKRKAMIINKNSTDEDKKYLSDPSPKFYEDTDHIRNINIKDDQVIININATNFETGIDDWKTKQERKLVLNGNKSKVFNGLPKVLKQRKNEILQEKRKNPDSILRNNQKREAENSAAIELENQQEITRLAEQEELAIVRLAAIKLKNQQDEREIISCPKEDHVELQRVESSVEKKKHSMWTKVFKLLLSIISIKSKKSQQLRSRDSISGRNEIQAEIGTEEPEAIIEEAQPMVKSVTETGIETTIDEPEIVTEEEDPKIAIGEEVLPTESPKLPETDVMVEENILPGIESGEVILADIRILIREEPDPIISMIKILKEEHNLLQSDVESVIDHIVSPISICDVLTGGNYDSFIQSLNDNENNLDDGLEIWDQVIQLIGPSKLSREEKDDIYNIFTSEQNHTHIRKRVITIALLLNALPDKFEKWWKKDMIPKDMSEKYESDYKHVLGKEISQEVFGDARKLVCSYAIEKPKLISKEYSFRKFKGGMMYENKAEKWLNNCHAGINYLIQAEIAERANGRYGGRIIKQYMTPDILLEVPIQLCEGGAAIHWIDAKNHFVDPALSPDANIGKICDQMNKYVRNYGPGLIIWGKPFSQEWNDATKGAVQHIKV